MRVLHVATAFARHEEDPITPWMVELLHGLQRQGAEVEVLAPSYRGMDDHVVHGIRVRRFRYAPAVLETLTHEETTPDRIRHRPWYGLLLPAYLLGGLVPSVRLGLGGSYDVVHVHWPMPHALFGSALRLASRGRTTVVSSFYSVGLTWVEHRLRWLRPLLAWSARSADALTANSTATADKVRRLVDTPVRVVPSPASFGEGEGRGAEGSGDGGAGQEPARPPLDGNGPVELLFVGRLVERKGVEYLVRALPRILEERPARLTIVGEGEWEEEIRRAVADCGVGRRVRLTGYVSRERLKELYRTSDLFVLPAVVDEKGDTEGLGVVLLEALLAGRPVVASAAGGIVDIVKPGRTGWLVPPGDPEALARAVLEAARDPEEARRRAAEGKRHVLEHFSADRIAGELLEVYRRASGSRRTPGPTAGGAGGNARRRGDGRRTEEGGDP